MAYIEDTVLQDRDRLEMAMDSLAIRIQYADDKESDYYDPDFDYEAALDKLALLQKVANEMDRISVEIPKDKTFWEKFWDAIKALGPWVGAASTIGGIIIHERANSKNLHVVTDTEEERPIVGKGFNFISKGK